jgi:hypothetical protein
MNPRLTPMLLFAAALLSGGVAAPASAFERQTVEGAPELPLYWQSRDLDVFVGFDGTTDTSPAGVQAAIGQSLMSWQNAGGGCTDINLTDVGLPLALRTNLDGGSFDRENRIIFRQVWPAMASSTALALTTVIYDRRTGAIQDADIDLNDETFFWTTSADGVTINDVENTITHELGHLLGFAHVSDAAATMFADSPEGETEKRTLEADDINAVCTIYPTGGPTPGVDVPTGISRGALTSASSCAVSRRPGEASPLGPALGLAVIVLVGRRRG